MNFSHLKNKYVRVFAQNNKYFFFHFHFYGSPNQIKRSSSGPNVQRHRTEMNIQTHQTDFYYILSHFQIKQENEEPNIAP